MLRRLPGFVKDFLRGEGVRPFPGEVELSCPSRSRPSYLLKGKPPEPGGVAQGGFKASAFSKASASWERGSDAEVCLCTTL